MAHIIVNFNQAQQQLANIEAIDYFFGKELLAALTASADLSDEQQQILMHLLIALSVSLRAGHTCLPITKIAGEHWGVAFDELGECSHQGYLFPSIDILEGLLVALNLSAEEHQPVVFDNNSLYMRRYYQFEWELAQGIHKRLTQKSAVSVNDISSIVSQLFPTSQGKDILQNEAVNIVENKREEIDWQKLAVANAIDKNFTVIAGGPGTGKTYTVTKLLAALLMLHEKNQLQEDAPALEIALVAPTGKAAQRLSESIINAIAGFKGLIDDDILAAMPTQAKTIHRLLGVIPNNHNFRHNQNNLLSCDVLLIDEVSMVDLPMMTRIFRALKPETKVILLGDADQLPSVAVGCVLADIAPRPHSGYSKENLAYLAKVCEIEQTFLASQFHQASAEPMTYHDHLSFLMKSRRFDGEGGIGILANYVIQGESTLSWQLLTASASEGALADNNQLSLADNTLSSWLAPLIQKYYQGIAQCRDVSGAFALLAKFRVLCVTRQGEFGVDALNQWIKEQLFSRFHTEVNYHGMPIMINENDYRLGLYNGDIGLLWRTEEGQLMAYFEDTEDGYKLFMPSRLPKYDMVYAMTIHKTQGSEFDHVAMVMPKQAEHQLLSRELLYTGITRAKTMLTISSNKPTWQHGVKTKIKRYSGLTL
ncbi:exodeoxyribonuclease V subunit alpha [Colwellia sp. 4_MG-2023]|uniref:exodeoxyribonuclease V subunit alpha n=1 Tax=unclassified Colwellia TaxID=196834 RepID=UPI0026E2FB5D|nr:MULTISPECIES: exodeoxyribonuclease V subunit alpha [unclassified Colwellia]MDO6508529.1 exodeoxyribonuclease V subunit alpha [Colwellia sp. 5_MG-2023]MDO6557144.1 exodeoxyribonuclease V subunit alpha [Colwellia sp. 4_MG-2023]